MILRGRYEPLPSDAPQRSVEKKERKSGREAEPIRVRSAESGACGCCLPVEAAEREKAGCREKGCAEKARGCAELAATGAGKLGYPVPPVHTNFGRLVLGCIEADFSNT